MKLAKALFVTTIIAQLAMAETVVLQQGTDGYNGTADVGIGVNSKTKIPLANSHSDVTIKVRTDSFC